MTLDFHPEALAEYRAAAQYYEVRKPGLGTRFVEAVEDAIERITESPSAWRDCEEGVQRCLTCVFPYAVYYTIEGDTARILAIGHCAREPGYWNERS